MKRILSLLLAMFLASCGPEEGPTSNDPATTSWAPRLSYANGATVPKVDRIRLVITLADGRGTVMEREADWSQGKVVVDGIPVGVNFNAVVKGELFDGSVVWSGTSEVGSGSGEVAIASQVTVASPLEIQLALDEADLQAPGSGRFPRVSVKDWPYADTGIHILYTTDKSVPMVSSMGTSTMEYAGPFTLQGSGTLNIRAVKAGTSSAMISSSVLSYSYSGVNPSSCNVPGFQPQSGKIYANGEVSISLDGMSSCALRYRTDGQDPSATDPLWSYGSVWLSSGTTNLKIRAFSNSAGVSAQSPVAEASWSCPSCTQPVMSIQANVATDVTVNAGMSLGLSVSVTGASGTDVMWSIDSGMGLGSVTGSGTSAQVYGMAGMSGTMLVKASLAGSGKFVVFRVRVNAGVSNTTLSALGSTQLSVPAGGTVQLSTIVTGADPSMVSWMIESGNDLLVFESGSSGASVTMRAGTSASGTATVRANLNGQSVYFNLTIGGGATSGTITASGATSLSMPAGGSLQLSTMVLNADVSQVNWTIESGGTYVYLPAMTSGSVVQLQAYALAGSGILGTASVRASLPNGNSVLFDITIQGGTGSGTIEAVGGTQLSLEAGKTLSLSATVTGADPMNVSWTVESGMTYAMLESTSGATAQLKAYAATGNGMIGTATVRASLPGGGSVLYSVTINGMPPDTSFTVSGDSLMTLGAGSMTWLYTNLTGGNSSDIVWSVDGNSGSVTLSPSGSMTNLSASTILANGRTIDTVRVRAKLGTSSRELTWRIVITGGEPLSFTTSGTSTYSLRAGENVQLGSMITGKLNPSVTWTVVSGGGTVTAGTPSTSCTYTAPSQVTEEIDVQVKGSLDGTNRVINYYITVSVRPKLEIVDSTGIAKLLYAPERRTAKLFEARRGTGAVAATWEVIETPVGATSQLYADGAGYRFKGTFQGEYRLVASEGGDADTVTVRWPPLPSIAFGPDSVQNAEPGEYIYMFPKVYPSDEVLTWSIGGTGEGSLYSSGSLYNSATSTYSNGAYYTVPSNLVGDSTVMEVTANMTSVTGKSLTYRIVVFPRGITVRDGSGHRDTVFTVTDTSTALELAAWRRGKVLSASSWSIWSEPYGNNGVIGSQENGVLRFKPSVAGTYIVRGYSSADGMYTPDVRVVWGSASP